MTPFISFGSIEQFRNVVKVVRDRADHAGAPLPKLTFHGTVKLHGTNAAVVYDCETTSLYAQSRSKVLDVSDDNAGFANWLQEPASRSEMYSMVNQVLKLVVPTPNPSFPDDIRQVAIYGEWCGGNIQKGVALNQLDKMFVIFGVRLYRGAEVEERLHQSLWLGRSQLKALHNRHPQVKVIEHFPTTDVVVDFAAPEAAQNMFVLLTQAVEDCCPVGAHFGVQGTGEGIVWTCTDLLPAFKTSDLIFKTKGAKHSDSKVKVIVEVDVEKANSLREFASMVLTDHRLDKMLELVCMSNAQGPHISLTGPFLKLVGQDVIKEESDRIEASGFTTKEVMPIINRQARDWFINRLDAITMKAAA